MATGRWPDARRLAPPPQAMPVSQVMSQVMPQPMLRPKAMPLPTAMPLSTAMAEAAAGMAPRRPPITVFLTGLVLLLCAWFVAGLFLAAPANALPDDCQRRQLIPIGADELNRILADHELWIETRDQRQPQGRRADLRFRDLAYADLRSRHLQQADLFGANLTDAQLQPKTPGDRTRLDRADLRCALMSGADLTEANLFQARLQNAEITAGAKLVKARLIQADLSGADLTGADLTEADLAGARLVRTRLLDTILAASKFNNVDLDRTTWQPRDTPDPGTLGTLRHLDTLRLDRDAPDETGMARLQKTLKDNALDDPAGEVKAARGRAITRLHWRAYKSPDAEGITSGLMDGLTAAIRWLVLDLPTGYGLYPERALLLVAMLWLCGMGAYFLAAWPRAHRPALLQEAPGSKRWLRAFPAGATRAPDRKTALRWSAIFSLTSAVQFGINDVSLLELVERFAGWTSPYSVTGLVRLVDAVQCLLSTGLIALWLLARADFLG